MTISAALAARYTQEVEVDWRYALVFEHRDVPRRHIVNDSTPLWGEWGGAPVQWEPVPFQIKFPARQSSGAWEYQIEIGGVGVEASAFLSAARPDVPITIWLTAFILGDPAQQMTPRAMTLTDPTVGTAGIVCRGTRADLLNRAFPRARFTVAEYPGLRRS